MIETALVYIHSVSPEKRFIGCGALVEGGYIVTCRHVWDQATAQGGSAVEIEYPRAREGGATVRRPASLADPCDVPEISAPHPVPDLVLLSPDGVPSGVVSVQLALDRDYETGPGYALAGLIRDDGVRDVRIEGTVIGHVGADGRRQFTGANAQGYWSERGSSGSPVFVQGGQQLAGILSLSELGANQGKSPLHEAFVIPATMVRRYLTVKLAAPVAEREHIDPETLRAVLVQIGADGVPIPEIPARLAQFVSAAQARAAEPVRPTNDGADVEAAIIAARDRLGALDAPGALAGLQATIAAEQETRARRLLPLLRERLAIERLAYDHDAAKRTLDEITRLAPDAVWAWGELGDLWRVTGSLDRALEAFRQAETAARRTENERDLAVSHERIGDVLLAEGEREEALKAYRASLAIRETLTRRDPGNAEWQRALAVSHDRIGDVLLDEGEREEALKAYRASLAVMETLARRDPGNTGWQRDLAGSQSRVGDALLAEGERKEALKAYRASLAVMETLARRDPSNALWQRDLSVSHEKIGNVLLAEGERDEALKAYRASLAIREALARRDPGNTLWQRDLIVSCWKIADASPPEARTLNARALAIACSLDTAGRLAPTDAWIPAELERRLAHRPAQPSGPRKTRQRSRRPPPRAGTPEP